jgi:UDP-N-acetylglucosamine acyltransferase
MATDIHQTAVVAEGARLGDGVSIGPFCVIGSQVVLGDGVRLHSHVVVAGITEVGERTEIFPFASIGHPPQDLKFRGEPSRLVIGARNVIREHVTMNPGTEGGGMLTRVGNDCLFMASAHVAHDCSVADHVILANNATLAGHVSVGDGAIIGGLAAVHQHVRVGAHAFLGGMAGAEKDVIPYGMVMTTRGGLSGLNLVGLKRSNVPRENITALREAYAALFLSGEGTLRERAQRLNQGDACREVREVLDFVLADSSRSFCVPGQ